MRNLASLLFAAGLGFLLMVFGLQFDFGNAPMLVGQAIQSVIPEQISAANIVTAVVLGYRGIDTLGELAILFAASTAVGLILGHRHTSTKHDPDSGLILRAGGELLMPLLLVVGLYIILHGHLTPGGGFQGGVILAAAFFIPVLARPSTNLKHTGMMLIEGFSGAAFILIGLAAFYSGGEFLQPLLSKGVLGNLLSAGTLPLLYLAVGLKVGAELAGLLAHLAAAEASES